VSALQNASAGHPAAVRPTLPDFGQMVREDFHLEFSNALAKHVLDWKPAFDFLAGATMTRAWLQFAQMLRPPA
jgi:nucleoside-diphosphate-sugar epimerase